MLWIIKKFEHKNNIQFNLNIFSKKKDIYNIYKFINDLENKLVS